MTAFVRIPRSENNWFLTEITLFSAPAILVETSKVK